VRDENGQAPVFVIFYYPSNVHNVHAFGGSWLGEGPGLQFVQVFWGHVGKPRRIAAAPFSCHKEQNS